MHPSNLFTQSLIPLIELSGEKMTIRLLNKYHGDFFLSEASAMQLLILLLVRLLNHLTCDSEQ